MLTMRVFNVTRNASVHHKDHSLLLRLLFWWSTWRGGGGSEMFWEWSKRPNEVPKWLVNCGPISYYFHLTCILCHASEERMEMEKKENSNWIKMIDGGRTKKVFYQWVERSHLWWCFEGGKMSVFIGFKTEKIKIIPFDGGNNIYIYIYVRLVVMRDNK
jgi:hypothetical protein